MNLFLVRGAFFSVFVSLLVVTGFLVFGGFLPFPFLFSLLLLCYFLEEEVDAGTMTGTGGKRVCDRERDRVRERDRAWERDMERDKVRGTERDAERDTERDTERDRVRERDRAWERDTERGSRDNHR